MSYYFSKIMPLDFDRAVEAVVEALKTEGFGVVTEIDIKATLKRKIGVDFRNYRILGACNPALAYEALKLEDKVGTMLPCNVIVQEVDDCHSEVAAIDPLASMQEIDNQELKLAAHQVGEKLKRVIDQL